MLADFGVHKRDCLENGLSWARTDASASAAGD